MRPLFTILPSGFLHFPLPALPPLNHVNADPPPIGLLLVFWAAGTTAAGAVPVGVELAADLTSPSERLFPSSKKRLLLSAGLPNEFAAVEETAREAVFGLSTFMPVSLRWYPGSGAAVDEGTGLESARRQGPHVAGEVPVRIDVGCGVASGDSAVSERVLSSVREGREAVDWRLMGRVSLSDPVAPALADSELGVEAAMTPGGRYLPGGGLAAADETEAAELS
jgi:hypothetical protein